MAEGVDLIAVDVGDGAIRADAEVAGHELDADHGAGLDPGGVAHAGAGGSAGGEGLGGFEAQAAKLRGEGIEGGAGESGEGDRRGDIEELGGAGGGFQAAGEQAGEIGRGVERGEGDLAASDLGGRRGIAGVGDANHFLDGADSGDGFLGEGEGEGDGSGEFAIDVDGAAAHALEDSGFGEGSAGEARRGSGSAWGRCFRGRRGFRPGTRRCGRRRRRFCRCRGCRA